MFLADYFKKQSREYEVPIWKLPDFLFLVSGIMNAGLMVVTYWLASNFMEDPRESVFVVALESVLILFLTNIIVESSKKIMKGSRLKKEFINIISHQVRSPLTSIKWSIESIKKEKGLLSEKQTGLINEIAASAEKIEDLMSDFIYLSKMEENKKLKKEKININNLLGSIKEANSYLAKVKKIKLVSNRLKNPYLKTDHRELKLILDNLIDNAIKYSFPETAVIIHLEKDKNNFLFKITNKGCGIAEKDKENIFTKFFRGEEGSKIHASGTGLGLFISNNLAKKMKGKIWFDSEKDKETVFYFKMPLSNND